MKIKAGYNDKPTHIRIGNPRDRGAEFWIEQEGFEDLEGIGMKYETLSYITLNELLDLKDEITQVISELVS